MKKHNLHLNKTTLGQFSNKILIHDINRVNNNSTIAEANTKIELIRVDELFNNLQIEIVAENESTINYAQVNQNEVNAASCQAVSPLVEQSQPIDKSQLVVVSVSTNQQSMSENSILEQKIAALGFDISSIINIINNKVTSLSESEIFQIFEKLRPQFRSFVGQKLYEAQIEFSWEFIDDVLDRIFSNWQYSNNGIGGDNYNVDFKFTKVIDLLQKIKTRINLAISYGLNGNDHVYESSEILEGSFYGSYKTLMYNLLYTNDKYLTDDEKKLKSALWNLEQNVNDNSDFISISEYEKVINEFSKLFKNYLKSKFGYSDSFIDSILDFAKNNIKTIPLGNGLSGFIQDYIKEFEENIFQLIQVPKLVRSYITVEYNENVGISYYEKQQTLFEYSQEHNEDYKDQIEAETFYDFFLDSGSNSEMQTKFLSSLLNDVKNKLNLFDFEMDAFMRIVFKRIANKFGIGRNQYGNMVLSEYDFHKLNSKKGNFDSSWIDEIYEIIQEEASKINPDIDPVPTKINADVLFAECESMDADYIFEHLDEMLLSNDVGVRKFAQIILDAMQKLKRKYHETKNSLYNCNLESHKKDLIKWIITFMNNETDSANPALPYLNIETINKLNNQNIFNKLNEIINSEAFIKAYALNIDGIIEEVDQGGLGDCYLLAAIRSLVSNSTGKEMIKNAITWAEDYSYATVYFAGENKYVTVSFEEFVAAFDNDNNKSYSISSDHDVVLIELAMEKLIGYEDLGNGGQAKDFWEKFIKGGEYYRDWPHGLDDLGNTVWGWITGNGGSVDISNSTVISRLEQIWNKKQAGNNFAATFSFISFNDTTYTWTTVDGEKCSFTENGSGSAFGNTGNGHTFSIVNITSTTVTFTNPWDSANQVWTVSWEEFARMGISRIDVVYF